MDDLLLEIESKICLLEIPKLEEIAGLLKIDITAHLSKGRLKASKKLRQELETLLDEHEEQGNKESFIVSVWEIVCGNMGDESGSIVGEAAKQQKDLEELQLKMNALLSKYGTHSNVNTKSAGGAISEATKLPSMLRKEFKIVGSIGGEKEKDKLSYVGLMRQIDSAVSKGYTESEIIDAVIRAIHSSSKLKAYLEIMSDISLQKLRQLVRVHYQEKTATELYQELTTLVQETKETPQDFLLRALSLRERVNFASKADDSMKYDPVLVRNLFVHSVETGLRDEIIRSKLRPVLHKSGFTDEELMESLNRIVSVEGERQLKMSSRSKDKTSVNSVNNLSPTVHMECDKPDKSINKPNLMSTLKALEIKVAELSAKVEATHEFQQSKTRREKKKCKFCEDQNKQNCDHCFKCGSTEHFARGCRSSGNDKQLRPRDRK